jgi:hypothetical protein
MRHGHPSPHVAVPWSVLLHRNEEVPSSNRGPETSQPTDFMVFTGSLPANATTVTQILPDPFHQHFTKSTVTLRAVQHDRAMATLHDPCKVWGTLLLCAPLIPNLATTWGWLASPGRTPTGNR